MLNGASEVDNGSFKTQPFWNSQNEKLLGHSSKVRRRLNRRVPLIPLHSYYNIKHYKLHTIFHTQNYRLISLHSLRTPVYVVNSGNDDSDSTRVVRASKRDWARWLRCCQLLKHYYYQRKLPIWNI